MLAAFAAIGHDEIAPCQQILNLLVIPKLLFFEHLGEFFLLVIGEIVPLLADEFDGFLALKIRILTLDLFLNLRHVDLLNGFRFEWHDDIIKEFGIRWHDMIALQAVFHGVETFLILLLNLGAIS